jgi:hypothetical protein
VLGDIGDDGPAFTRRGEQLCLSGAKDKGPASQLSLKKQHGAAGIDCRGCNGIQSLHQQWGKIAEKMLLTYWARRTVIEDVETVG